MTFNANLDFYLEGTTNLAKQDINDWACFLMTSKTLLLSLKFTTKFDNPFNTLPKC